MPLADILETAKETILEHGQHAPVVIVEGKGSRAVFVLTTFGGETAEKRLQLFQAGLHGAEASGIQAPETAYFVTETWVSKMAEGTSQVRPRDDPRRKEALMVNMLQVATRQQTVHLYEMLRDGSGRLIDLVVLTSSEEAQSTLLPAFMAGFLLGQRGHARKN